MIGNCSEAGRDSNDRTIVHSEMFDPFTRLEVRLHDVPEAKKFTFSIDLWMRTGNHTDMLVMEHGMKPKAHAMQMRIFNSLPSISMRIRGLKSGILSRT